MNIYFIDFDGEDCAKIVLDRRDVSAPMMVTCSFTDLRGVFKVNVFAPDKQSAAKMAHAAFNREDSGALGSFNQ